jgi:hypothetical protein
MKGKKGKRNEKGKGECKLIEILLANGDKKRNKKKRIETGNIEFYWPGKRKNFTVFYRIAWQYVSFSSFMICTLQQNHKLCSKPRSWVRFLNEKKNIHKKK